MKRPLRTKLHADASLLPSGRAHRVVGTAAVTFSKEEDAEVSGDWPMLPADSAHVTNMAVDQKLRKQGIARLLLATCEDHARKAGWSSISLVRVSCKAFMHTIMHLSCSHPSVSHWDNGMALQPAWGHVMTMSWHGGTCGGVLLFVCSLFL